MSTIAGTSRKPREAAAILKDPLSEAMQTRLAKLKQLLDDKVTPQEELTERFQDSIGFLDQCDYLEDRRQYDVRVELGEKPTPERPEEIAEHVKRSFGIDSVKRKSPKDLKDWVREMLTKIDTARATRQNLVEELNGRIAKRAMELADNIARRAIAGEGYEEKQNE